ncbi:hypothetical protein [Aquimarina sp. Aq107]|uniref:hypothetical protein n=1 Tax=Aquimarina sp. Aq107 TaxID=1191912 RepID=UPI000D54B65D|nr:hypothetical protein [Aquimarina sp. Aq107]
MDNGKDIGKVFKEHLGDFNKSPENVIWKDLEAELDKTNTSKRIYWLRIIGIAALFIMIIVTGVFTFIEPSNKNKPSYTDIFIQQDQNENCNEIDNNPNGEITNNTNQLFSSDNEKIEDKSILNKTEPNHNDFRKKDTIEIISVTTTTSDKTVPQNVPNPALVTNQNKIANSNTSIISDSIPKKIMNGLISEKSNKTKRAKNYNQASANIPSTKTNQNNKSEPFKRTISKDTIFLGAPNQSIVSDNQENKIIKNDTIPTDVITENNEILKKTSKDTLIYLKPVQKKMFKNFNFAVHAIPTYTIPNNGSLVSDRLLNNEQTGKLTLNYGVVLTADFNEKISLRTGYNRIALNTKINDIKIDTLPSALLDSNILIPNTIVQSISNQETVDLTQKVFYHELSAGLAYKIINNRFDWSIIGGASFLILQKNNITLQSNSNTFNLGRSNNLKSTNTSINFGSNLRYLLFKNTYINVEPIFKYQMQSASKNQKSYKPLYFTIQTGLSIDF